VLHCMESELPPNLLYCLRLLRVLELQLAHFHLSNQSFSDDLSNAVESLSKLATSKIEQLLILLCTDETVGEQLRPHLFWRLVLYLVKVVLLSTKARTKKMITQILTIS